MLQNDFWCCIKVCDLYWHMWKFRFCSFVLSDTKIQKMNIYIKYESIYVSIYVRIRIKYRKMLLFL